jgi:hypothetical protein
MCWGSGASGLPVELTAGVVAAAARMGRQASDLPGGKLTCIRKISAGAAALCV